MEIKSTNGIENNTGIKDLFYVDWMTFKSMQKGQIQDNERIRSVPDFQFKPLINFLIQYPTLEILHKSW